MTTGPAFFAHSRTYAETRDYSSQLDLLSHLLPRIIFLPCPNCLKSKYSSAICPHCCGTNGFDKSNCAVLKCSGQPRSAASSKSFLGRDFPAYHGAENTSCSSFNPQTASDRLPCLATSA